MIPIVVLVGRPNVGKSTLFNCLTNTRNALVSNFPTLTRDRNYGYSEINGYKFIVTDTAGIEKNKKTKLEKKISNQLNIAILESNIILFIVDAKFGLMHDDYKIAKFLRCLYNKPIFLVINKIDVLDKNQNLFEFYSLGFKDIYFISAAHKKGINKLTEKIFSKINIFFIKKSNFKHLQNDTRIKIAIIGRPNVGKSTITNCMIGNDRVIVDDLPGTTRDSIYINTENNNIKYTIIDTAGIRKRKKISNLIEKFSIIKSMQSIEYSNISLLVIDPKLGILDQDITLLNFIIKSGKSLLIVVNKWDNNLSQDFKENFKKNINYRLKFIKFIEICFISALYNQGIDNVWKLINKSYNCSKQYTNSAKLTKIMKTAIEKHPPQMIFGRQIKLKYAHPGGYNPLIIVIHGNQVNKISDSYKRYLKNYFLLKLKMSGVPIIIQFKNSINPFMNKKNNLRLNRSKNS